MRRKAQAGFSMPMNQEAGPDQLIADLLKGLQAQTIPVVSTESTHQPIDLKPTTGTDPYSEMSQIVEHEATMGEPKEAAAFDKLSCGLQCLEKGLALFEEYEAMEEEEEEVKGEKKEKAALKKINSLIEDMKKVYKDLVDAEVQEHDEKSELEASKKDEDKDEEEEVEVEEKKEASVKGFTRQASQKKESFVPRNLRW